MVLVLAIILFIIFLIYSIKPIKSEEYTLEGLKLSWKNKAGIDGVVTKWIVTLKDSSNNVIHTYENSDASNLKDYTDVDMNIVNNKDFDTNIIGDNTLELYYNETKDGNKLYTKTVTFTQDDFGMILDTSNLEEIDIPPPTAQPTASSSSRGIRYVWFGYENSDYNRPLNIREIEVYSGGVNIVKGLSGDKVESITGFYRDGNEFPPQQLFDQKTSRYNFGHTNDGKTNYFKIDLGKKYSVIDKVMVYNRIDCCHDRWASSFVKLLDDNGDEIVRSTDTLPSDRSKATNYKEGGVRVKTFTFGNTVATPPPPSTTPTNQDCEGHWINDPTGRSSSKAQNNYKTMKYVVTKPKSGTGKDCMWAFTRKNPGEPFGTDPNRNWAGYAFGDDQWTSEVVTNGQKGEVFNYQNTKGYRMNDTTEPEEWKNLSEWKQNYLRFCMRKPNVALDYSKVIDGRGKDVYTDAYGTIRYYGTCRDDDD